MIKKRMKEKKKKEGEREERKEEEEEREREEEQHQLLERMQSTWKSHTAERTHSVVATLENNLVVSYKFRHITQQYCLGEYL